MFTSCEFGQDQDITLILMWKRCPRWTHSWWQSQFSRMGKLYHVHVYKSSLLYQSSFPFGVSTKYVCDSHEVCESPHLATPVYFADSISSGQHFGTSKHYITAFSNSRTFFFSFDWVPSFFVRAGLCRQGYTIIIPGLSRRHSPFLERSRGKTFLSSSLYISDKSGTHFWD